MISLIQWIFLDHVHKWEKDGDMIIKKIQGRTVGISQPCVCKTCGELRTFQIA